MLDRKYPNFEFLVFLLAIDLFVCDLHLFISGIFPAASDGSKFFANFGEFPFNTEEILRASDELSFSILFILSNFAPLLLKFSQLYHVKWWNTWCPL